MACRRAVVEAGSRIHLGFHLVPSRWGRWGGAGIYLDSHRTVVEAKPARALTITPEGLRPLLEPALEAAGISRARIAVRSHAPRHVGLGSTTQLVLSALAAGYTVQHGRPPPRGWVVEAARAAGRGRNGWVGTLLWLGGGFVACPGEPRPIVQAPLPRGWVVVLLHPLGAPRGRPEEGEEEAISRLPPAGERIVARMQRGLYEMLLGLAREDIDMFASGLQTVQGATGQYFSPLQGGTYRRDLARLVDEAQRDGIVLGQSSWGPTLYTVTTRDRAESDAKTLRMISRIIGLRSRVEVVEPRNTPAIVECLPG